MGTLLPKYLSIKSFILSMLSIMCPFISIAKCTINTSKFKIFSMAIISPMNGGYLLVLLRIITTNNRKKLF